jgi:UDP-glucuronate 4-epimerase
MKILITGTAGFIGFHLAKKLIDAGHEVMGYDNINDYYDVNLKYARLTETGIDQNLITECKQIQSSKYPNYSFVKGNLENASFLETVFAKFRPEYVCNLAAQAGVRYSLQNPSAYLNSNISGFLNILEMCRKYPVKHLVYASSSSVYGLNKKMPLSVSDNVDHPISLYAASKKSNELMAHTYSYLFGIPTTGLRFFTVYGPWGRPDMALFIFTKNILENRPIEVYNNGNMVRDFTFVEDISEGISRVLNHPAEPNKKWEGLHPDPATSMAPYRIYNIGNSSPVKLLNYIDAIEKTLGKKAEKIMMPMQPGDVPATHADVSHLEKDVQYKPKTPVEEGIRKFIKWYKEYYKIF